jgi:hypothetical protein
LVAQKPEYSRRRRRIVNNSPVRDVWSRPPSSSATVDTRADKPRDGANDGSQHQHHSEVVGRVSVKHVKPGFVEALIKLDGDVLRFSAFVAYGEPSFDAKQAQIFKDKSD